MSSFTLRYICITYMYKERDMYKDFEIEKIKVLIVIQNSFLKIG